jgi:hypothetical protein
MKLFSKRPTTTFLFAAVFSITALIGNAFAQEHEYILYGAQFFGSAYSRATARIDFKKDDTVSGEIKLWDNESIITLEGTNFTKGTINIKFSQKKNLNFILHKSEYGGDILRWDTEGHEFQLYRYIGHEISNSGRLLSTEGCGPSYGAINVRKSPKYAYEDFLAELQDHPELNNIDASIGQFEFYQMEELGGKVFNGSLPDVLRKLASIGGLNGLLWGDHEMEPIGIEIGTEAFVVKSLRSMNTVQYANLAAAGCDGADRVFFVTAKKNLFDGGEFSEQRYLSLLESGLRDLYTNEGAANHFDFYISQAKLRKLRVPPYSMSATYQIVAASELTRGTPGEWDSFRLVFEPFDTDTSREGQYSIAVYDENLMSSKRSFGSTSPPGPEYFLYDSNRTDDEDTISQVVQRYFAQHLGGVRCEYMTNNNGVRPDRVVRDLAPCAEAN